MRPIKSASFFPGFDVSCLTFSSKLEKLLPDLPSVADRNDWQRSGWISQLDCAAAQWRTSPLKVVRTCY